MSTGAQGRAVTPLEPEPDLPAGLGASPREAEEGLHAWLSLGPGAQKAILWSVSTQASVQRWDQVGPSLQLISAKIQPPPQSPAQ